MAKPKKAGAELVERRGEIYRKAAEIFHSRGFHATSIEQIADAVGLTKAGLYYYIDGKQDLLLQIMQYAMDRLEQEAIEPARTEATAAEKLIAVVRGHADLVVRDSSALTILVNELEGLDRHERKSITKRQRRYFDFLRGVLVELDEDGKLLPIDPTVGAFGLLGMILWISRWYRPRGRLKRTEVVHQASMMAIASLLKPEFSESVLDLLTPPD